MLRAASPCLVLLSFVVLPSGCAPATTPGMAPTAPRAHPEDPALEELARAAPRVHERALLVAYAKTACSGSARMVFVDRAGRFQGAVGPGEAGLLTIPDDMTTLVAISTIEIQAPETTSHTSELVPVPPGTDGILVDTVRVDARRCARNGQYATFRTATKRELEATLADHELRWLAPAPDVGQAWLDRHRPRLAVILSER